MQNMPKVNNKVIVIVDFEQVIAGWDLGWQIGEK